MGARKTVCEAQSKIGVKGSETNTVAGPRRGTTVGGGNCMRRGLRETRKL